MKPLILSAVLTLAIAPFSSIAYSSPFVGEPLKAANPSAQTKIAQSSASKSSDSARILVQCGPGGASRIVETVPPGCHVLLVNSPPAGK